MSYEMKKLRKEDLSIYYFIKDVLLADFVEKEESVALTFMEAVSTDTSFVYEALTEMLPRPTERGRGWLYFDELLDRTDSCRGFFATVSGTRFDGKSIIGIPEQSQRVVVYDTTTTGVISPLHYIIDYIDGRVITSGTVTPAYVDYYWNYVSVVDEWAAIEAAEPPVIVIDLYGTDKTGFQLGGGKQSIRKCDIHVFASNMAERNDLVETIYDGLYLKSAPLMDFPLGSVLDYDGTWFGRRSVADKLTTLFDRTTVSGVSNLRFENVVARHVSLPLLMTRSRDEVMLSDLNAYRSKISFDVVSYIEG